MNVGSTFELAIAQVFGCSAAFALKRFRSVGSIWMIPHDPVLSGKKRINRVLHPAGGRDASNRPEQQEPFRWKA
jgi:hypothetical protein